MVWWSHQENSSIGLIDTIISEPTAQRGLVLKVFLLQKWQALAATVLRPSKFVHWTKARIQYWHVELNHCIQKGNTHSVQPMLQEINISPAQLSHQLPYSLSHWKHWSQGHVLQGQISSDAASGVIYFSWRSSYFTKQHNHQFSAPLTFRPLSTKVSVYQVMKLQV